MKSEDGKVLFDEKEIFERWIEYIEELYSDKKEDLLTGVSNECRTVHISEMEDKLS